MRHTSKTLTALVAVCTVLSCHAGIVTATEVSEGEANSGGRLQRVIRSSKSQERTPCEWWRHERRHGFGGRRNGFRLDHGGVCSRRVAPSSVFFPPEDVRSPDPLVAVVRNLLKEGGAKDLETQACLLLTKMADAMLEGLTVCDDRGTIVYVNSSLCRMLGTTRAEVIGRSATEVFPGIYARFVQATSNGGARSVRAFRR